MHNIFFFLLSFNLVLALPAYHLVIHSKLDLDINGSIYVNTQCYPFNIDLV